MNFKFSIKFDPMGIVWYFCMALLMRAILPDDPTSTQWACVAVSMLVLVIIDVRSFRQGLSAGCDITRDAMRRVLADNNVEVVRVDNRTNV